jgi:hypothetical protein
METAMPRSKGALKARERDTTKRDKAGHSETMRRDYEPRFCKVVIGQGRQGKSRAQIAVYLGVTRKRIASWEATHPEFREAMEIALDYALAWWETKAQKSLNAKHFQAGMLNKMLASRYPDQYGDKSQLEVDIPITKIIRRIVDPKGRERVEAQRRARVIDVDPMS